MREEKVSLLSEPVLFGFSTILWKSNIEGTIGFALKHCVNFDTTVSISEKPPRMYHGRCRVEDGPYILKIPFFGLVHIHIIFYYLKGLISSWGNVPCPSVHKVS